MNKERNCDLVLQEGMVYPELKQPWWKWPEDPTLTAALLFQEMGPLAVLRAFPRGLILDRVSYPAVGIGGVYVLPKFRGKGLGTLLMKGFLEELKSYDEVDYAVLFAHERTLPFYKRLGFMQAKYRGDQQWMLLAKVRREPKAGNWTMVPEWKF